MKKFGLESASSIRTIMSPNVKLTVDLLGKSVDSSLYKSMIGILLYLTASRPDISYSVGVCARYRANPKESHMITLKRIIKYKNHCQIWCVVQQGHKCYLSWVF